MTMVRRLFDWKVRGVRWVEIFGLLCVAAMLLSVYLTKASAARETSRIAQLEREIDQSSLRVRMLRAEVARLESPARLEALSRQAGLAPIGEDAPEAPVAAPAGEDVTPVPAEADAAPADVAEGAQ
ncbi:cell division protein [Brevundimonas sp. A19_0]|uniref:cell division protein FtsL n=1 Tax=Brevundimonas sp. A19_0 TaxID=2821087 RepID=UPI001ADBDA12|nr:cell division protein [Brevundimonas sp. A19_0]MBO9500155.1 cell division protein [Brevundimonas sp. A19_0]